MSTFDKDYMNYWKQAVEKSVDGTVIAGPAICASYVAHLNLAEGQKVLDLGCSFGRMFPVLREKTSQVFGLDLDLEVVNEAAKNPYVVVVQGKAEQTPFPSGFFDAVMAWAVFDGVDQKNGYVEINRLLKVGGRLLATGKNAHYLPQDELGFIAERNAFCKGFPNRFTDLKLFLQNIGLWGFTCEQVKLFKQRGDLGLNQYSPTDDNDFQSYEYALVLKKIGPAQEKLIEITRPFSFVAEKKAKDKGYSSPEEFLREAFSQGWT